MRFSKSIGSEACHRPENAPAVRFPFKKGELLLETTIFGYQELLAIVRKTVESAVPCELVRSIQTSRGESSAHLFGAPLRDIRRGAKLLVTMSSTEMAKGLRLLA